MARPKIDPTKLVGMVDSARNQEAVGGFSLTDDPNFPTMPTPVNKKVLVYIPTVGLRRDEGGVETWDVLTALVHRYKQAKNTNTFRCIHGLAGDAFDELGYDGTCPACEAVNEGWELFNAKLDHIAQMKGIDRQNDPGNALKDDRAKANAERPIDGAEEFIAFPVVVIPWDAKNQVPEPNALEEMKPYFVYWRKERFDDSLMKQVNSLIPAPTHPAGLFWIWDFTYDTGGKQPNARDSAKNASYSIIQSAQLIQQWEPLRQKAEELAKDFTIYKAAEVLKPVQFMTKEELTREVGKIMSKTRAILARLQAGASAAEVFGGVQAPQANPLLGAGQGQSPAQLGGAAPAQLGGIPAQLGGANPTPATLGGASPQGSAPAQGASSGSVTGAVSGWGQAATSQQ